MTAQDKIVHMWENKDNQNLTENVLKSQRQQPTLIQINCVYIHRFW